MNSVFNKVNVISDFLHEHKLDIFGVAETWLLPDVPDSFVSISNYGIIRTDTQGDTSKHGVCIYIQSAINFISVDSNCSNLCVVHLIDFNLYIIVVYRPPSNNHHENSQLIDFLLRFCPGKEVLVMGDFNLPALAWNIPELLSLTYPPLQQLFLDCFTSLGLHQWVNTPTYVHSGNILDLILTTDNDRVGEVEVLGNFPHCGHCPIKLQYYFQCNVNIQSNRQVKYSWHRGNYARLNSQLAEVDWEYEMTDLSIDGMLTRFKSILFPLIDLYVPIFSPGPPRSFSSPPNALKTQRKIAWQMYKESRNSHGRRSQQALLALDQYNDINF